MFSLAMLSFAKIKLNAKTLIQASSLASIFFVSASASALESTAVLPKGIRNLQIKMVDTHLRDKSNESGNSIVPLSEPLSKDLTFSKALRSEKSEIRRSMMRSAMLLGEFTEDDSLGRFTADLRGHVQVFAPIMAYGLTDKITLAVAAPYYRAATEIEVGFKESPTAQRFVNSLTENDKRQFGAAQTAFAKIDGAVFELNKKLRENGYEELNRWEGEGFGDTTVAAKWLATDRSNLKIAYTGGFVIPTGEIDKPNVLTDIGFGDGTWDAMASAIVDIPLPYDFMLNGYGKYTHQFEARRDMRLVTEEEPIEGELRNTRYKLGDKINAGTSLNYAPDFGLISGIAYEHYHKYGDNYKVADPLVQDKYEKDTFHVSRRAEFLLGYSTIPAFRRKEFAAPLKANLFYSRYLSGISMPNNDLIGMDIALFF